MSLAKAIRAAKLARHTPRNIPIRSYENRSVKVPIIRVRSRRPFVRSNFDPPIIAIQSAAAKIVPKIPNSKVKGMIEIVADYYGLSAMDVTSQRRQKEIARARQIAMYLAKTLTPHSYPIIGRYFNDRDHTTVMYGVRKIARLIQTDEQLAADVVKLTQMIQEK